MFPSVAKSSGFKDKNNPVEGITVSCSQDAMKADFRTKAVEVRGSDILGGPLSLGLSIVRRNGFFLWTHPEFFIGNIFLSDKAMLFTMAYHFKFHRDFYKKFATNELKDGEMQIGEDLLVANEISHCGRTSCVWDYHVKSAAGESLLDSHSFLVATDNETRKPTPIAPFFDEGKAFPKSDSPPRYKPSEMPTTGPQYTCERKIIERYIDPYKHVNYKVYIWMTMECLTDAFNNKAFPMLSRKYSNFLKEQISEYSIVYAGECRLGQTLEIKMWESEDGMLCTHIVRDGEVINYSTISFF